MGDQLEEVYEAPVPRKGQQRGTPDDHLLYMLERSLGYASNDGVVAAARALLPHLGACACPVEAYDCRPGACDCDGAHDALAYALRKFEAS